MQNNRALKLSVVTCVYDPDMSTFKRTLMSLQNQTLPKEIWEYIVVDNNSTTSWAMSLDLSWLQLAHIVKEERQGLTPARLKGIEESTGDIILFVDDDMVLDKDYLKAAVEIFEAYPFVGVLGGCGEGEYAHAVPNWLEEFRHMLCDFSRMPERKQEFQYAMTKVPGPWIPVGAGMAMRRDVALHYRQLVLNDPFRMGLDRTGDSLAGSGDADIACEAIEMGYASATTNRMKFTHIIPAERMTCDYMEKLLYWSNFYSARLLVYRGWRKGERCPQSSYLSKIRERWRAWRRRNNETSRLWHATITGYRDGLGG